jgi:hypothetical protein
MPSQQSSVAPAKSGLHILASIKPHVLKHPKTLVSQSSITLAAETTCVTWKNSNLMLLNNKDTLWQSSNMLSLSALTTGFVIHHHQLIHSKIYQPTIALLTPKRSTKRDKSFTSCLSDISRRLNSNLRSKLHKAGSTFWWEPHLMCWDIRGHPAHNLR